jgi:hypothetical protein
MKKNKYLRLRLYESKEDVMEEVRVGIYDSMQLLMEDVMSDMDADPETTQNEYHKIDIFEMTESEFDALPEFEGY